MRVYWLLVLLFLALVVPMRAHAALACTYPVGTVDFGSLTSPVPQTDNTPNPTLSCTGGTANTTQNLCITISPGTGGLSGTTRLMTSGANTLQYQIFYDSSHSIPWGDNSVGGFSGQQIAINLNASGNGTLAIPLYGRISAQTVASGSYTSTGLTVNIKQKPGGSPCSSNSGSVVGTATFTTKVIIGASCTISAPTIDFGNLTSLTPVQNLAGSLLATCTNGAPYTIALNGGTTTGNTIAARKMSLNGAGAGVVTYQLYRDTGPTNVWGDGTAGNVTYSGSGNGSAQTVPVYAQLPSQATPASGIYKDTVTVTVSF